MKKVDYVFLFLIANVYFSLIATIQKVPGYMDAEYYYGQAVRITAGNGFSEPFIWNYLNSPTTIPVPGFSFWLPLTSFIASAGLWFSQATTFYAARIPFILMASVITILTAWFANQFLPGRRSGWLAGGLAIFSGFYLPFITITDTFTPYMLLGGLFFLFIYRINANSVNKYNNVRLFLLGLLIGLMALTRSDGIFWLLAGFLVVLWMKNNIDQSWGSIFLRFGLMIGGFCLVMVPWGVRNLFIFGSIFPPGNGLMVWLTEYIDIFVYPSTSLTYLRWIETGFIKILADRGRSLGLNLQTLISSGGGVILLPLMVIGYWVHRKDRLLQLTVFMVVVIFAVMSIVFPFAGSRGGFFHSLSSVQIILWAIVPVGLDALIKWGCKHRKWKEARAWKMFGLLLIISMAGISAFVMFDKVNNGAENGIPWNESQKAYTLIGDKLNELGVEENMVVMINNPPRFSLVSDYISVMIPSGGAGSILEVCDKFGVDYLALNDDRQDIKTMMIENSQLSGRYDLIFEEADLMIYEYQP